MGIVDLAIIALALASGFFGISYNGIKIIKTINIKVIFIPFVFAIVSCSFLCIGYFLSLWLHRYYMGYESHVVFFILAGIGVKTFLEGTGKKKGLTVYILDDLKILFTAAILFSLNYIFIGISLLNFTGSIGTFIFIFAGVTIVFTSIGLLLGKHMKFHITDFVTIIGGIVLIAIGSKILMLDIGYI